MSREVDAEVVDPDMERVLKDELDVGALAILNKSEIDQQIATAKRYPRSVTKFLKESQELACLSEDVAGACMYALKRSDKTIEGPSARFAEIVAHAWGNCRAGARIVGEDQRFITAQGFCFDLEKNVAIYYETKRRITNKHGEKFLDDMVGVTANAACSIALRNAVLKVIPKALWNPIYEAARKTAVGDSKTLVDRRTTMLQQFAKMGATPAQVFGLLEVKGEEDITLDHLAVMRGLFTSIKEGETTVDQAFERVPVAGGRVKRSELNETLGTQAAAKKKPPQQPLVDTPPASTAANQSPSPLTGAAPGPVDSDSQQPPASEAPPSPQPEAAGFSPDEEENFSDLDDPPQHPPAPDPFEGMSDALAECRTVSAVTLLQKEFLASTTLTSEQGVEFSRMCDQRRSELQAARKTKGQASLMPSDGGEAYGR